MDENNNPEYGNITDQQLKRGYWLLTHKKELHQALVIFLILVNLGFWGFSLYKWTRLFYVDLDAHKAMMLEYPRNYVNFEQYKIKDAPRNFKILGIMALDGGGDKYDLMAKVENPNPQWMGLIEYRFSVSNPDIETKIYQDFILPGDFKYLLDLGVESSISLGTPKLDILNLKWEKVRNAQGKKDDFLKTEFVGIDFQSSRSLGIGKELPVSRLNFTAWNRADYNFWKSGFAIVLYSGARPVAVNYIVIDEFLAGQKRDLEVSWFNKLPSISKSEVKADINILDASNYRDFEGSVGPDIRDYGKYRRQY